MKHISKGFNKETEKVSELRQKLQAAQTENLSLRNDQKLLFLTSNTLQKGSYSLQEDQEFAQTKKSLLISHLIFERMKKLNDTLFFYFLDRGTYF
jgi:hypothetical protein